MEKIKNLWSKLWFRILSISLAVFLLIVIALSITISCLWGDVIDRKSVV